MLWPMSPSPRRGASSLVLSLLLLAACAEIEPGPPPLHPRAEASAGATATTAPPPAPTSAVVTTEKKKPSGPRVGVENVSAEQRSLAESILAAARQQLAECRPNENGATLVRIRITSDEHSASMRVEPDSSADIRTRHCVLEALSTLDIPDTLSQSSPSSRPSAGFTSLISVEW